MLGFDRFEQHRYWRCSGRVEGEVDDIEPRTFAMERHDERWVLTGGDGSLVSWGMQPEISSPSGVVRSVARLRPGFTRF